MINEIANVIKTTKPRHILNALVSPYHTLKVFKYHYRRVSEKDFISFFVRQKRSLEIEIDKAYMGLHQNNALWTELKEELSLYPNGYGQQMTRELPALYMITRILKPDVIMETGVSSGASSAYMLQALYDNNKGKLYSIDLPTDNLPPGKTTGWIVPQHLRSRWKLNIGDSKNLLEPILSEIGEIDCFIHDSLNTYDHMMLEFNIVWDYLR